MIISETEKGIALAEVALERQKTEGIKSVNADFLISLVTSDRFKSCFQQNLASVKSKGREFGFNVWKDLSSNEVLFVEKEGTEDRISNGFGVLNDWSMKVKLMLWDHHFHPNSDRIAPSIYPEGLDGDLLSLFLHRMRPIMHYDSRLVVCSVPIFSISNSSESLEMLLVQDRVGKVFDFDPARRLKKLLRNSPTQNEVIVNLRSEGYSAEVVNFDTEFNLVDGDLAKIVSFAFVPEVLTYEDWKKRMLG